MNSQKFLINYVQNSRNKLQLLRFYYVNDSMHVNKLQFQYIMKKFIKFGKLIL